ncbi:unnamed protein product, partial [Symbiodinium pilosum]
RGASRPDDQDEDDKEGEGITLKEGPGATRPTEAEADSAEASQECALACVKEEQQSDDSIFEPV